MFCCCVCILVVCVRVSVWLPDFCVHNPSKSGIRVVESNRCSVALVLLSPTLPSIGISCSQSASLLTHTIILSTLPVSLMPANSFANSSISDATNADPIRFQTQNATVHKTRRDRTITITTNMHARVV